MLRSGGICGVCAIFESLKSTPALAHLSCNFRQKFSFATTYVLQPLTAVAALSTPPLHPTLPQHVRRIFAHLAMAVDGSHCARLFNKMASVSVSAMRCTLLPPPPLAELKA